ncbi:YqgE/AlgH family protein [Cribrihabitans pelagius]|uniref:YqgE/AlgH family protein n=1 Tax=Cribrihabitans pelagius TaxID=1765746 RepID=UPI003B5C9845
MELTGKLLIAMPGIGDPRFEHAVIFLCSQGEDGAMGLIVNKPAAGVALGELLEQLDIGGEDSPAAALPVRFGGPVETQRGFVLHSDDYVSDVSSLKVAPGFSMTATLDILEDIARGAGPEQLLVLLGYAGWGPDQLESEIAMNGWLTTDASPELVFGTEDDAKWGAALKTLGVDPLTLSASAGHA